MRGAARWIGPVVLGAAVVVAVGIAGLAVLLSVVFPENDDIVISNKTSAEITDVTLTASRDGAEERAVAHFARIAAGATATAEDAGFGRFSVAYEDAGGRWIAHGVAIVSDRDDVQGPGPLVLVVAAGRVGSVAAEPRPSPRK